MQSNIELQPKLRFIPLSPQNIDNSQEHDKKKQQAATISHSQTLNPQNQEKNLSDLFFLKKKRNSHTSAFSIMLKSLHALAYKASEITGGGKFNVEY